MNLQAPTSLNTLGVTPHAAAKQTKLSTHVSPSDLSGIISHSKKNGAPAKAVTPTTHHEKLQQQAQQWIAQTFFGTMLKQMRESPFKSDLFEGGKGGQAFGQMYDQRMVEQMSRGAGKNLVKSLVRSLEHPKAKEAYRKQQGIAAVAPAPTSQPSTNDGGGNASDDPRRQPAKDARPQDELSNPYRNVRIHVAPALRS